MHFHDHDNEFEELLQHHADKHRMYPSDRLWQQIQTELHGQDRWPALTVACIAVIVLLTLATAFLQGTPAALSERYPPVPGINLPVQTPPSLSEVVSEQVNTGNLTHQTMAIAARRLAAQQPAVESLPVTAETSEENPDLTVRNTSVSPSTEKPVVETETVAPVVGVTDLASFEQQPSSFTTPYPLLSPVQAVAKTAQKTTFNVKPKPSKLSISYYGGASSSFRLLTDNNYRPYNNGNYIVVPTNAYYNLDVNNVVNQAPSVGFELGAVLGYQISPKLKLYAGLQANYREYKIRGYGYSYEPVAIALRGADTLNTTSQYRLSNNSTYTNSQPVTLHNRGIELSIPVGFQWEPLRWRSLSVGIGANVQPTYVINKTPFVVSTDYKSYAQSPSLMRKFNLNTSVEAYLRYQPKGKKYGVTLGPQIRYQQLPTLSKRYPIREYLYDYGVKLGITKTL